MNESIQKTLAGLPERPGVYLMKDENDTIIYVGKARVLKNRVRSYFQNSERLSPKTRVLVSRIDHIDYLVTATEAEALVLECNLIKQFRPFFNISLKDDKHYPYLKIDMREDFPRIEMVRKKPDDGSLSFGPYTNATDMWEMVRLLNGTFGFRTCKNYRHIGRACLNHHIHRCSGPCIGAITSEEYKARMQNAVLFLKGDRSRLIKELKERMMTAAENLQYEKAAEYRNQIRAVENRLGRQLADFAGDAEFDVMNYATLLGRTCIQVFFIREGKIVGEDHFFLPGENEEAELVEGFLKQFYLMNGNVPREILLPSLPEDAEFLTGWLSELRGKKVTLSAPKIGKKKELINMAADNADAALKKNASREEKALLGPRLLADAIGMAEAPKRVEAFDISNFQGTDIVSSMVVFTDGLPDRKNYRRFKIKTVSGAPDDFQSMEETLYRRMTEALSGNEKFLPMPDLILIDGGKGQLGRAVMVLKDLGIEIPLFGLAKREEEIFLPGEEDPILLDKDSPALFFIQRVRNEAHRFAITFHRSLRKKRTLTSELDNIPGVGKKRRDALIRHFGSVSKVRNASVAALSAVEGISGNLAKTIYEHLH